MNNFIFSFTISFSFHTSSISREMAAPDAPTKEGFIIPPPIPLSERNFRRRRPARRYGSIRVEECSFVEHDGTSPSQPPVATIPNYSLYETTDVYPQKRMYVDKASMVPKQHSSPKRKCIHPQNEKSVLSRANSTQRTCQRHDVEILEQSSTGGPSRKYAPLHYHRGHQIDSSLPSKMNRTSSLDKCSVVMASSPTEEYYPSFHRSRSRLHKDKPSETRVTEYRDFDPYNFSQVYETDNKVSLQPRQPSQNYFGTQSSDHHLPKTFHPKSKNQESAFQSDPYTEPAFTLDLIQHATGKRGQYHNRTNPNSNSFESLSCNRKSMPTTLILPTQTMVKGQSPKRNISFDNASNRNSTGSNIIPPPHDFESDNEEDEVISVETGFQLDRRRNQKETNLAMRSKEGNVSNHSKNTRPSKEMKSNLPIR